MQSHRYFIFFLSWICFRCRADPGMLGNATVSSTSSMSQLVGFVQDPDGRGTTSLVTSCLLTLVLCVWSALHLNVPRKGQSKAQSLFLNVRWIITGIYAPELVVFTAWRQWSSARLLQSIVQDALRTEEDKNMEQRYSEWTMTHSFFACTGGFAFELQSLESILPINDRNESGRARRITLTARGVALLARYAPLPRVSRADIEDKSKANDLAKATVMLQATWMIVQVLGRLAFQLPVTLLEVNTVAHV